MHPPSIKNFLWLFIASTAQGYSYDGTGNNIDNPSWGAAGTPRIRSYPPSNGYADQISIPVTLQNNSYPSARRIVEELFHVAAPKADEKKNQFILEFGHFIAQDVSHTVYNSSDSFSIPCDGKIIDKDLSGCPFASTLANSLPDCLLEYNEIQFNRSSHDKIVSPRASLNTETSFLDLSNIYGVSRKTSKKLRRGKFIATDVDEYPSEPQIMNGVGKTPGVYAISVIFVRYHNLQAAEFAKSHPFQDDNAIFEMAREKTIAVYQNIIEESYIPTLLGSKLDKYDEYDSSVNPSIDEFFTAVSFRYGHSSLAGSINILDKDMNQLPKGPLAMRDIFENNVEGLVKEIGGIEPFLRGLVSTPAKAVDPSFVDDYNFYSSVASGLDVQRGRDMGIPSYNNVRKAFGLPPMKSYEELAGNDPSIVAILQNLYGNDGIKIVDAYVGALIEKREDALHLMGPIFTKSIVRQFSNLRDGDRFWYKVRYSKEQIATFPSFSDIIKTVSSNDMSNFPSDVFICSSGIDQCEGPEGSCSYQSMNSISVLDDKLTATWSIDDFATKFDLSLNVHAPIEKTGYMGVGWGGGTMSHCEFWYCVVNTTALSEKDIEGDCDATSYHGIEGVVSCCVAPGTSSHVKPTCLTEEETGHYPLKIIDACMTNTITSIALQASICPAIENNDDDEKNSVSSNCFDSCGMAENRTIEFIAAYDAADHSHPHGPAGRTSGVINLSTGLSETSRRNHHLQVFSVHGFFMLFAWLFCAPLGIYIAHFRKSYKLRVETHMSIMGIVATLMLPLILTAERSAENSLNKHSCHSLMGRIVVPIVHLSMIAAGYLRHHHLSGGTWFNKFIGLT